MRCVQRAAVAGALERHDFRARRAPLDVRQGKRDGPLDETGDLERPRGCVHVRNVEMREQVVETDGRDLMTERL
jgi:hypothetical protein